MALLMQLFRRMEPLLDFWLLKSFSPPNNMFLKKKGGGGRRSMTAYYSLMRLFNCSYSFFFYKRSRCLSAWRIHQQQIFNHFSSTPDTVIKVKYGLTEQTGIIILYTICISSQERKKKGRPLYTGRAYRSKETSNFTGLNSKSTLTAFCFLCHFASTLG